MADSFRSPEFRRISQLIRSCRSLPEARRLHEQVVGGGEERCKSRFLANLLVEMFGRCGSVGEARGVYDGIEKPNLFSTHIMIHAYAQNGHLDLSRQFFSRMATRNEVSWSTIIAASCANCSPGVAETILDKMPEHSNVAATAVMRAFARELEVDRAAEIFRGMQQRDLVSWTVLLDGFTQAGNVKKAAEIFDRMPERDNVCWTVLCHAHAILGQLRQADELFREMPEKTFVSWTAIIYAYAQNGHPLQALELFWKMDQEGVEPDEVTFVGVLTACSHAGRVKEALSYFTSLTDDRGLAQLPEHLHCLIDALGRAGLLQEASKFVRELPPSSQESVAWTSLLDACRVHGDLERGAEAAMELIELEKGKRSTAPYLLLSNIYAAARRPEDAMRIRQALKSSGLRNDRAGRSRVEELQVGS